MATKDPSDTRPSAPPTTASTASTASEYKVIRDDKQFGCVSKETLSALVGMAAVGDSEAFQRGLMRELRGATCIIFQANTAVYLVEFEMLSGLTKVRPRGSPTAYWTVREALAN